MSEIRVDASGLFCPLPVIRLQDQVAKCAVGDLVQLVSTDPGAINDVPAWCRVHGHQVVDTAREGHRVVIQVRVQGQQRPSWKSQQDMEAGRNG